MVGKFFPIYFFSHLVYAIVKELTWLEKSWEAMGSKNIILSKFFQIYFIIFVEPVGKKYNSNFDAEKNFQMRQSYLLGLRNHFVKHLFYYFQISIFLDNFPIFFSHSHVAFTSPTKISVSSKLSNKCHIFGIPTGQVPHLGS